MLFYNYNLTNMRLQISLQFLRRKPPSSLVPEETSTRLVLVEKQNQQFKMEGKTTLKYFCG